MISVVIVKNLKREWDLLVLVTALAARAVLCEDTFIWDLFVYTFALLIAGCLWLKI